MQFPLAAFGVSSITSLSLFFRLASVYKSVSQFLSTWILLPEGSRKTFALLLEPKMRHEIITQPKVSYNCIYISKVYKVWNIHTILHRKAGQTHVLLSAEFSVSDLRATFHLTMRERVWHHCRGMPHHTQSKHKCKLPTGN